MEKSYSDFINDINSQELYEGFLGYGLFSSNLPPFLTSYPFYLFCKNNKEAIKERTLSANYISYQYMRNINIPRTLGIPNPFCYHNLCSCIQDNWDEIKNYFEETTRQNDYKISRIHIRKRKNDKRLFLMNYNKFPSDINPYPTIAIGAKYLVEADVSNCFPSIYTHSLSWALVGKTTAKQSKQKDNNWYDLLDLYTRNCKDKETHGLIVGPDVSNLLSEIILTKVDCNLSKKWKYIRNIDDYSCYTESYDDALDFVTELSNALSFYDLALNHKKTKISKLPFNSNSSWVQQINSLCCINKNNFMNYKDIDTFFNAVISIFHENQENASIFNYAIKLISNKELSHNAIEYYWKIVTHLALIYPYLIQLLENFVFHPFNISVDIIEKISTKIFNENKKKNNYEGMTYALYFATKYNFEIKEIIFSDIENSKHCLLFLIHYLYEKKVLKINDSKHHKNLARTIKQNNDFDKYWLYVYEVQTIGLQKDKWKLLKQNDITFVDYNQLRMDN